MSRLVGKKDSLAVELRSSEPESLMTAQIEPSKPMAFSGFALRFEKERGKVFVWKTTALARRLSDFRCHRAKSRIQNIMQSAPGGSGGTPAGKVGV